MATIVGLTEMPEETCFAPLGVLGYCLTRTEFLAPVWAELGLPLKTVDHAPQAKLLEAFLPLTPEQKQRTLVRSAMRVVNRGRQPIPIRWFPHPFYPQSDTDELCRFSIPVSMPDNPAYELLANGYIARKGWPWTEGHYQALDHAAQSNPGDHAASSAARAGGGDVQLCPGALSDLGNRHTFSWEPFLERTVAAGQQTNWWNDYDF